MFSEDAMRERFHDLGKRRAEILETSAPLRERRDKLVQEFDPQVRELNARIKEAEVGLYDVDQERAALSRALKGKTGEPPGSAEGAANP
jgi:uncharacterized coiled-coil DUF342 family protein